jgi:hypothetical protein
MLSFLSHFIDRSAGGLAAGAFSSPDSSTGGMSADVGISEAGRCRAEALPRMLAFVETLTHPNQATVVALRYAGCGQ